MTCLPRNRSCRARTLLFVSSVFSLASAQATAGGTTGVAITVALLPSTTITCVTYAAMPTAVLGGICSAHWIAITIGWLLPF